ncbi:MAG: thioredoxin domain-containing protein, partial [Elusimicrobia bacterium]|nr:thioredoxin domain-containing protein [Elusimicrobiota bacterium]
TRVSELWRARRADVVAGASSVAAALRRYAAAGGRSGPVDGALLDGGYRDALGDFDAAHGGFGGAPKFPMPVRLDFLLCYWARTRSAKALEMAARTLTAMADGGVRDQLGGGFHRYSVDARWRVPHFEQMLYDNAQLAAVYVEGWQATKDAGLAEVARGVLAFVRRDMTSPGGGFYSALDADSRPPGSAAGAPLREGAYYTWRQGDILAALGPKAGGMFSYRYGVDPTGNVGDAPRGEFAGLNVLYAARSLAETAARSGVREDKARASLEEARRKLLAVRGGRPAPRRDDKIMTSWNGLMISAFARAAWAFDDAGDLAAATRAARFIRRRLYDARSGRLSRYWRAGARHGAGLADDYAFLVQGLLDLYGASSDPAWLAWAERLTGTQQSLFYDAARGGLYLDGAGEGRHLLARLRTDSDDVEPAASSVAAMNLLRLWQLTDREDFRAAAERTLASFAPQMKEQPGSLFAMLSAAQLSLDEPARIVIAGRESAPDTRRLLRALRGRFLPGSAVIV